MLEMKLIVHGRVQGVGYRYGILERIENEQINVRGYVSNRANGTVEIVAQGDIEALKDLRRLATTPHSSVYIRDVEEVIQEIEDYTYDTFSIEY